MNQLTLWEISYRLPDESVPPRFLTLDLETQALAEWIATIFRLQVHGDALSGSSVFTYDSGLHEYRGLFLRIFYRCLPGRRIEIVGWTHPGQDDEVLQEILKRG